MPLLPQLQAHARVLRRSADSVQIGLVDGAGIVVSGLHADEIEQLTRLARRARAPRARSDIPGLQEPDPAAASGADLGVGRGTVSGRIQRASARRRRTGPSSTRPGSRRC